VAGAGPVVGNLIIRSITVLVATYHGKSTTP